MPEGVAPLPLGSSDGAAGHQFQSFGFPDQSPEEGLYGEGQLIEQTSILGMKVWQVKSSEITPGFSGGPVFDEQARHVVGMVTSIAAPDKFGRLSETAFVTPAETLFSIYPAIAADFGSVRGVSGHLPARSAPAALDRAERPPGFGFRADGHGGDEGRLLQPVCR